MPRGTVLAVDAGTTGVKSLLLDARGRVLRTAYEEFRQHYPRPGWVEHDPEELWRVTWKTMRRAAGAATGLAAVGITNQRETTILWNRRTGRPIHRAIVWQCRRTAPLCEALKRDGAEPMVRRATGLVLDPYFSATKIHWLLRHVPGAASAAARGELAFGTVDSWLIWKLTGGRAHVTDPTNASRTLLYHIGRRAWDPELLKLFGVSGTLLPRVAPSAGAFGTVTQAPFRGVPICGVAGDQQAALFGQGGVEPGSVKNTYGTGCFLVMNTGAKRVSSRAGLLTTLACGPSGEPTYALEGSVFIAGAAVQWLRDRLEVIRTASETEALARGAGAESGVFMVPAFAGLGAPYWNMHARGAVFGLTGRAGRADLARAVLEAIAFQTRDVVDAMERDTGRRVTELRVDGGAAANDFLMQFQSDLLGAKLIRPRLLSSTGLGAGLLAGLGAGVWERPAELLRHRDGGTVFRPRMKSADRRRLVEGWRRAVAATLQFASAPTN